MGSARVLNWIKRTTFLTVVLVSFLSQASAQDPFFQDSDQDSEAPIQRTSPPTPKPIPAPRPPSRAELLRQTVNQGTVGVLSGGLGGTFIQIASDLSSVLDDDENQTLRILPIAGKGGIRNIRDLLFLRGVDLTIVQSDVLDYIETNKTFTNIRRKIHYISKLHNAELHILTSKNIATINDLAGKKVNFWHKDSSTDITGKRIFKNFGIKVSPVYFDQHIAIEKVKSGEIAASLLVVGKPSKRFMNLQSSDNLKLLPIKFEGVLANSYLPSKLSHEDYPALIPPGQSIETIAAGVVLAVYNWPVTHPRYKRVANFINAFFSRISEFQIQQRHPKWREINLNAKLKGWTRFSAATNWLKANNKAKDKPINVSRNSESEAEEFRRFIANQPSDQTALSPQEQQDLFQRFLEWQNKQQN